MDIFGFHQREQILTAFRNQAEILHDYLTQLERAGFTRDEAFAMVRDYAHIMQESVLNPRR